MATILWRGDAAAVKQVNTITPANVLVGNTFSVTINGKVVTYTAAAATVADVVAGLQLLLAASTLAEFVEVVFTVNGTTNIVATAATAGVPFTQTSSAAGGTATNVTATTTASSGPKDWSTAANWTGGILPAAADDVYFSNSANDCLYGLDQHTITLNSLTIDQSFTGKIGNARNNALGYLEYRPLYLQVSATTVTIGNGPGTGSGRIKLDTGSVQTALSVNNSGSPAETGIKSVLWKGTHASNTVNLTKGSFATAYLPGETAVVATWQQAYQTNQAGDVDAYAGPGVTLTTIVKTGGTLIFNTSFTTLTQGPGNAGETQILGGTVGTVNITGGTFRYMTGGNATAITAGDAAVVDFSRDARAKTVTNMTLYPGATVLDPQKIVTFTNPVALKGSLSDYTLNLGALFNLQRS